MRLAGAVDEDVTGLEITMQYAPAVGVLDRARDRGHQAGGLVRRAWVAARAPCVEAFALN